MDQVFSFGKKMFGGGEKDGNSSFSNPFSMLFELDRDGDGKITEEDFVGALQKLGLGSMGDTIARQAFKQVDGNGNGKLDMSEVMQAYEIVKDLMAKAQSGGQ